MINFLLKQKNWGKEHEEAQNIEVYLLYWLEVHIPALHKTYKTPVLHYFRIHLYIVKGAILTERKHVLATSLLISVALIQSFKLFTYLEKGKLIPQTNLDFEWRYVLATPVEKSGLKIDLLTSTRT